MRSTAHERFRKCRKAQSLGVVSVEHRCTNMHSASLKQRASISMLRKEPCAHLAPPVLCAACLLLAG